MKKILIATAAILYSIAAAGQVNISHVEIKRTGNKADITFDAQVDKKATRSNYKLIMTPVLTQKGNRMELPPIVVESRRTRIMDIRNKVRLPAGAFPTSNGKSVRYRTTVDYQSWISGADIRMDRLSSGCCSEKNLQSILVCSGVSVESLGAMNVAIDGRIFILEKSSSLPSEYAVRDSAQTHNRPATAALADNLLIDFAQGSAMLNVFKLDNYHELSNLIDTLCSSKDILDGKIRIVGYASPEGGQDVNLRLAMNRALAVRNYILDNVPSLRPSDFDIVNGGENWEGLAKLLEESNMPGRWQVIDIIERTPALIDYANNTSRKKQLMDINGGRTWMYMQEHYFAKLRSVASVTMYKKPDDAAAQPAVDVSEQNKDIINRAIDLTAERNSQQALELLTQVEADPRAWNPMGVCYMLENNPDKARVYFQKALDAGYTEAKANLEQLSD